MKSIFHAGNTRRFITSDQWYSLVTNGAYCAVIFDCDGTLVESANAHFRAFHTAAEGQGYDMNRGWYQSRTGLDRISTFEAFAKSVEGPFDVSKAADQSIQEFIQRSASVKRLVESGDLVDALRGHYPMAVGTNSEIEVATASLKAAGLFDAFQHIVCISDGLPPKPASDIFACAADRLGFSRAQILVFEDSQEGVCAALSAGLDVVQLITE